MLGYELSDIIKFLLHVIIADLTQHYLVSDVIITVILSACC